MNSADEAKIQKLLNALEEAAVILKRAQLTCAEAEKQLRVRLNDQMEVVDI